MNSEDKIIRSLYRALFRVAKKFDDKPSSKLFLYRNTKEHVQTSNPPSYHNVIDKLLSNKTMYVSDWHLSFSNIVRDEFKYPVVDTESKAERVDAGFSLLRKFSSIWSNYHEVYERSKPKANERSNISSNLRVKVEEVAIITPGTILISHPLIAGPLNRSVILVLENDSKGTYGLVLNRPTLHTLKTAVRNFPQEFTQQFGDNKIFYGGKIRRMQFLHDVPDCEGIQIPNCKAPLYYGGLVPKAVNFVKQNTQALNRFHFFVGCCIWGPDQLTGEISNGYWIPTKAAADELISITNRGNQEENSNSNHEESKKTQKYRNGRQIDPHQIDVYDVLINSLGDKYKHFADFPQGVDHRMIESCD
jgi:putative transcriptional regulator